MVSRDHKYLDEAIIEFAKEMGLTINETDIISN